jgi:hypothetical protein
MIAFLSGLPAALPYLVVFWLIPLLVITVKMMRRAALSRRRKRFSTHAARTASKLSDHWTLGESAPLRADKKILASSPRAASKPTYDFDR